MLDVHPVHGAIRGWRDFLVHILIVAIGLLLALGLGQTVEFLRHRYQVIETRRALQQERADNRETFAGQTRGWRVWVAELKNNLIVFQYLQQHPGTPREKLPGVPVWEARGPEFSRAVWDAAQQSGVIAHMPREEIENSSSLYDWLRRDYDLAHGAAVASVDARAYALIDPDPSHLTPAQVADEIRLVQTTLVKVWLLGTTMENLARTIADFPATVTIAELEQVLPSGYAQTQKLLAPAESLTLERLKAAAGHEPPANAK